MGSRQKRNGQMMYWSGRPEREAVAMGKDGGAGLCSESVTLTLDADARDSMLTQGVAS